MAHPDTTKETHFSNKLPMYRMCHVVTGFRRGKTTEPVLFFAASENQHLDIVKTVRKKPKSLDLSPYPTPLTEACFA
jgi:hypothetical protein